MGHSYRTRHAPVASTTTKDLAGLGAPAAAEEPANLDDMTKDELLEYARSVGASPANASMTKDELRASIDAAA